MKDLKFFESELEKIILELEKEEKVTAEQSNNSLTSDSKHYYLGCNSATTLAIGKLHQLYIKLITNK